MPVGTVPRPAESHNAPANQGFCTTLVRRSNQTVGASKPTFCWVGPDRERLLEISGTVGCCFCYGAYQGCWIPKRKSDGLDFCSLFVAPCDVLLRGLNYCRWYNYPSSLQLRCIAVLPVFSPKLTARILDSLNISICSTPDTFLLSTFDIKLQSPLCQHLLNLT